MKSPPSAPPPASAPRRRHVPGLVWTTFEGVEVLAAHHVPEGNVNYVAVRDAKGTYEIIRLEPRWLVRRRVKLGDVAHTIKELVKQDIIHAENVAFTLKQEKAQAEEARRLWNDQPGFYIVPGESVDSDGNVHNASGPYHVFEKAGFPVGAPRQYASGDDADEDTSYEDVEDDAIQTKITTEGTTVSIIEARNPRDAAAGKGYIWWQDGRFTGPPVDPRQTGFRF